MRKLFLSLFIIMLVISCREPSPQKVTIDGVKNAVRVGNYIFCSQPSKIGLKNLANSDYKTVLSTRGETELNWDEAVVVDSLGMAFVSIPMPGPVQEITDIQVNRFDKFMASARKPVVLHCGSGNRVSGLWAVWLVEKKNMVPEKALEFATQTGMKGVRKAVEKRLGMRSKDK